MSDVRDILELEQSTNPEITKETILGIKTKQTVMKTRKVVEVAKRPEGMHREVYALLCSDKSDPPPLFPTYTGGKGYKQTKANLGMRKVRKWRWLAFDNPGRMDNCKLYHWRRLGDEGKEYPFAKFNKSVTIPSYTDAEYQQHLQVESWTKAETDHLFMLCKQFDLRFIIIQDRWDRVQFKERTIEQLKQRYYDIVSVLAKKRSTPGHEPKLFSFDSDNEARRKKQLELLYNRTTEQIEEEQTLITELRKIEARKRERERKTQDLQKLITAADHQEEKRLDKKVLTKKKLQRPSRNKVDSSVLETAGIKFADIKTSGVFLRTQKMKLPASVGQKKTKTIEQLLQELGIEFNPMPTEEICTNFNELRNDMVLLYELKSALSSCEFEVQALRHEYEALAPGKTLQIPEALSSGGVDESTEEGKTRISEIIDVVGTSPNTIRKRKAAIDQGNVLKKLKART